MQGLKLGNSQFAAQVKKTTFDRGLIIELCGPDDEVIKFMPPLNISEKDLFAGVQIVKEAIDEVASSMKHSSLEGRLAS